ncbi:MAG: HAD family hydrolase [Deltaproteobacteria bacterium]|nr:MAG: HAD family hydrolase [Deltaproteobacteria bacterium]
MPLLLFDIDGTLIDSGRIGSRAIAGVFQAHYGIQDAIEGFFFDGKTDREIFRELMACHGLLPATEAEVRRQIELITERYLEHLRETAKRMEGGAVHPGVLEILEEIQERTWQRGKAPIVAGLLTGNVEAGARIKLQRFDLAGYFPFGAFGSDAEVRSELVPIALERAQAYCGWKFSPEEIFVVGDSVRDIECARKNGVVSIAVATGSTPREILAAENPDHLFDDLSDTERFFEIVGGHGSHPIVSGGIGA